MTEWTFSRVTSVGAAHPCPTRRPEWTARNTISAMAGELWADRAADVLSEADEELIDVKPEFFRDGLHETLFRLFRGFRADQTEPVADPVHVGVRGNPRFAEPVHEHAVRRLRPDLRKRNQFLVGPGDCAAVLIEEDPAHVLNLERLLAVEADRLDQAHQIRRVGVRDRFRCVVLREELPGGALRHLVPSPL